MQIICRRGTDGCMQMALWVRMLLSRIMGLLKSLSFNTEYDSKVWELCKDANELGTKLDYTLEIIDAAMQGNIDFASKQNPHLELQAV